MVRLAPEVLDASSIADVDDATVDVPDADPGCPRPGTMSSGSA